MPNHSMQLIEDVVALGAIINADPERRAAIADAARRVNDWSGLAERAEREAVAPVLYRYLESAGAAPAEYLKALRALAVRHRHATAIRLAEFSRISDALGEVGIDSAALKGVALAGLIYPDPGLRPMRDIDFLVHPANAARARTVLEKLGYRFEDSHPSRFMRLHHHLPNARREVDGLAVSVEVHTRANSGDSLGGQTMADLHEPLQRVDTPYGSYFALGHIDMLNQLCRHALEPGNTVRLVSVMDIQGYCAHFDKDIDWTRLGALYRYIPNFLSLLDLVVPLPRSLARFAYHGRAPADPGKLIPTISEALSLPGRRLAGVRALLVPPAWWFSSYYGVGADGHGTALARLRHLSRLSWWVGRRLAASLGAH